MAGFLTLLWRYRSFIVIFLTPLVFLPLPLVIQTQAAQCGYVIIIMALYWCTECIPIAVTALLPVIFYPMMGIMQASEVASQYLKDSIMLFMGGLLVAMAVERWKIHTRIALHILLIVGLKPSLLLFGIMVTTALLSMWISNAAATAMMLPITSAVLQQLKDSEINAEEKGYHKKDGQENQAFEMADITESNEKELKEKNNSDSYKEDENGDENDRDETSAKAEEVRDENSAFQERRMKRDEKYDKWRKGMCLSVCYASSIGGTATLTGTTPNVILQGQINQLFPENGGIITFASFFAFSFPNMVLTLALSWLWLQFMFFGFNLKKTCGCSTKKESEKEAYKVIRNDYKNLGRMSFAEVSVLVIFTLLVLLWFTRDPGFMPGWATVLFNKDKMYVTDGTVSILVSSLYFCIPSKLPRMSDGKSDEAPSALLTWQIVHEKMPWSVILLLGGGFALAEGSAVSGLSTWLGESLLPLQSIPPFAISILLCLLVALFTECSSNTATATLFLPILASMATAIKIHPLYVMLPCTFATNLAFMLPVATPPNAIAFSFGNLKIIDMAKAGFMMNIIGVITINFAINTWGMAMFQLDTFPSWANSTETP